MDHENGLLHEDGDISTLVDPEHRPLSEEQIHKFEGYAGEILTALGWT